MEPGKAKGDQGPFGSVMPIVKTVLAVSIGIIGCFLIGVIGSMTYPGWGAIAGAGLGFLVFTCIGCCALGVWKDFMPKPENVDLAGLQPSFVTQALGKHGNFTMIVTVHKGIGISTFKGFNPFASPDVFVTAECGKNPPKATCVKSSSNPEFNEQFKLRVLSTDRSMVIKVMDQDVFGSDVIGYVTFNVDQDIIGKGFPQEQSYTLQTGAKGAKSGGTAKIVLSFDYTDDFPNRHARQVQAEHPEHYETRQHRITQSNQDWGTNYGSCSHLQTLQFNTNYEETMQDRKRGEKSTAGADAGAGV